jgi:hypothetical protein
VLRHSRATHRDGRESTISTVSSTFVGERTRFYPEQEMGTMMKGNGVVRAVVLVGFSIISSAIAHAQSQYNAYTRQWEDVSPDSVPQLNPVTGRWQLAPPNSVAKLNPYTRQYEMVPPNSISRFNPYTKRWELAPPDATLELNPHTKVWHYVR